MENEKHSDELLAIIASSIKDHAFFQLDAQGAVATWNPAAERIKGYKKEEILGKHFSCFYPQEKIDLDEPMQNLKQAQSSGAFETEGLRSRKDGRLFWANVSIRALRDEQNNLSGYVKVIHDLTYRKQIEEHRSHLTAIVESSNDAIITTKPDGTVCGWNRGAQALYGYSAVEVLAKSIEFVFAPSHLMPSLENLSQLINFETTHVTKAGTVLTVAVTVSPMKGPDDKITEISWICHDSTDNTKLMDELKRSNKDLQQFAYVASHDLQEPVRAVIGCLQLLEESLGETLNERSSKFLSEAKHGATRMQVLVKDLLSYARVHVRAAEPMPVDVAAIFSEAIDNLKASIDDAGAQIICEKLPMVQADGSQMQQVFQNLIGNAIKYRSNSTPEIHVSVSKKFDEWIFCISDNGIGFDIKFADRIFGIFQRLHSRSKYAGTGIGLAICKSIIERHGGRVWVESELSSGSKFFFSLPVKFQGDTL